jgi:hypothetical protein
MGSTRSYQDVIWDDPAQVAKKMVAELIEGHDKRKVSTAQYREKADAKKDQGNFSKVYKFVAEQKETKQ